MTLTLHKIQVHALVSYSGELAVHSCPLLCLQRQVANLVSGLFYCWSLLCNNNIATNVLMFTSNYDIRCFAAYVIVERGQRNR